MSKVVLPPLREVVAQHQLSASKALGQNFLFDEQLLDRIAAIPGLSAQDRVVEVGPGPGGLTRALLRTGAQVTAIERDPRCLPALEQLQTHFDGRLSVIHDDALTVDHDALMGGPYHVVANLPYNVGTALLVQWLSSVTWPPLWHSLTLMFQQEVAERIVAAPGESAFGRLAILAQWRATARIAMRVHRSAFTPPPKVQSAVVYLKPTEMPVDVDPTILGRITAAAFGQRRKMLRQSLKGVPGALAALHHCQIDETRRAETLTVQDFLCLSRAMND